MFLELIYIYLNFMKTKLLIIFLSFLSFSTLAQKDPIERVWFNQPKSSKIQIYKAVDGNFYGKIVWLAKTHDEQGLPRVDKNNPIENLKQHPLNGLIILKGFKKNSNNLVYEDGTIYDPNNGKKYCGKISLGDKILKLRGSICGFSIFGKSTEWTLAE